MTPLPPPKQHSPWGSHHHLLGRGKLLIPPLQNIFKDLSPHLQNGKGLVETIIGEETFEYQL